MPWDHKPWKAVERPTLDTVQEPVEEVKRLVRELRGIHGLH